MAIEAPPLVEVLPGDAITAEGWNNLIKALRTLFGAVNETGNLLLARVVDGQGNPVTGATVTLDGPEGPPRVGLYAGAGVRRYVVPGIADGVYVLTVEAADFATEKREVEVSGASREIEVEMTRTAVRSGVPDLFGQNLVEAAARLTEAGFKLGFVLDIHGRELTSRDVKEGAERYVLNQSPEPATRHASGGSVNIAVSALPTVEERIKVPDVRGLSLDETKAVLAEAGLVLGGVKTQSK